MEVYLERRYHQPMPFVSFWEDTNLYLSCVSALLLPATLISIITIANIRRCKEMLIKRNIFVVHIMICYIIITLFEILEAIRLHSFLLDSDTIPYWFIYPTISSITTVKYVLTFCFLIDTMYNKFDDVSLKVFLSVTWCLALFYMILQTALGITYSTDVEQFFVLESASLNFGILSLMFFTYLLRITICSCTDEEQLTDDQKIRFDLSTIIILCSIAHTCIDFNVKELWPYLFLYVVDSVEVIVFVLCLTMYDANFKYLILRPYTKKFLPFISYEKENAGPYIIKV